MSGRRDQGIGFWRERRWEFEPDAARRTHLRLLQRSVVPTDPSRRELREMLPLHVQPRVDAARVTELVLAGYRKAEIARHYDRSSSRIAQMHTIGGRVFGYSLLGLLASIRRDDA